MGKTTYKHEYCIHKSFAGVFAASRKQPLWYSLWFVFKYMKDTATSCIYTR